MQGAVHDGVFACLSKWLGGSSSGGTECFASPFNSALPRFFSAFPIDGHFGSHGDFFLPLSQSDFLRAGWYEMNPPFSPGVMNKTVQRIEELLGISCEKEMDVTFIVVIPTARSAAEESSADKLKATKKKKNNQLYPDGCSPRRRKNNDDSDVLFDQKTSDHLLCGITHHRYTRDNKHLKQIVFRSFRHVARPTSMS